MSPITKKIESVSHHNPSTTDGETFRKNRIEDTVETKRRKSVR